MGKKTSGSPLMGRRWALVLFVGYGLALAAVVLSPLSFESTVAAIRDWTNAELSTTAVRFGWVEFGLNIALFVPVGALLTVLAQKPWAGVVGAVALSAAAELTQGLIPDRTPSMRDLVANTVGACVGALLAWTAMRVHRALR